MKKNIYQISKRIKFSISTISFLIVSILAFLHPVTVSGETNAYCQTTDQDYDQVAAYLNANGYIVYWIQPIPGTTNYKAGVNNGKTVIVYTNENCILGHLDSGNN